MLKQTKNPFVRSPTLSTVLMIEKVIEDNSGEFNRTELWKKLPRKVMWQTYQVVLDYLESINKIAFDKKGIVGYIWSPELAKKFTNRKKY
jgi:GR25 family glycosyltransferase involved in LPS biosynthesis